MTEPGDMSGRSSEKDWQIVFFFGFLLFIVFFFVFFGVFCLKFLIVYIMVININDIVQFMAIYACVIFVLIYPKKLRLSIVLSESFE